MPEVTMPHGFVIKPIDPVENLPEQWIWSNINGRNFLTNVWN
jgi:hypothetical protein